MTDQRSNWRDAVERLKAAPPQCPYCHEDRLIERVTSSAAARFYCKVCGKDWPERKGAQE